MTFDIQQIHNLFRQPPTNRRLTGCIVIALDGRSGSGKTSISAALKKLDPELFVLHVEDFYPGWDGLDAGIRRVAHEVLGPWQQGEVGEFCPWDWHRSQLEERVIEVPIPASKRVLIEGCGAGANPIAPFISGLVWLAAPEGIRKQRALNRDGEVFRPYWEMWAAQEQMVIDRDLTPDRADLTLNTIGVG